MENYIKKLKYEYKDKKHLYEEYCSIVIRILETILIEEKIKHQIFSRIKNEDSLEKKLIRKKNIGKIYNSITDLNDVAAIRVIFYINKDKNRFVNRLTKEISGQIIIKEKRKDAGYNADHLILSFGEKRLSLSEYKKFEGLKCEIQLTLILDHVWSEIEHDIIYKDNQEIKEKDAPLFDYIENEMKTIYEKHIKKAISGFENVFKKLK